MSGEGTRSLSGSATNYGTFETRETTAIFKGEFINEGDFISDSSEIHFGDLIIGEDGYMQGDEEDLWRIKGVLSGVEISDGIVTNILGPPGMRVYYVASVPENSYLRGLTYELTGGGALIPIYDVAVDIKPQSCPNPLNTKSKGVLPVAILGTDNINLEEIDVALITLERVEPIRYGYEDVGAPFEPFTGKEDGFDCTDAGPDGIMDLTLKFDTQGLLEAIEAGLGRELEDGEVLTLTLTGNLQESFGGNPIQGEDVVVILKKGKQ